MGNSKQLNKPFRESAFSLFCSPVLEIMQLFCSWVLELCSALRSVPNAMQAEASRGHWKAQRYCVLEMFKNRTGGFAMTFSMARHRFWRSLGL